MAWWWCDRCHVSEILAQNMKWVKDEIITNVKRCASVGHPPYRSTKGVRSWEKELLNLFLFFFFFSPPSPVASNLDVKEILLICVRWFVIHSQEESSHLQSTVCQFNLGSIEFVIDCIKDTVIKWPWKSYPVYQQMIKCLCSVLINIYSIAPRDISCLILISDFVSLAILV